MHAWSTIGSALALVFSITGLGIWIRRLGWLSEEADASLVRVSVRLLLPCLVLSGTRRGNWMSDWSALALPPATGFGLSVLGFLVAGSAGYFLGPAIGLRTAAQRRTFALCTGMYNYGFVPIPLVTQAFPNDDGDTLAALLLHNVGVELALWTVGLLVLTGHLGRRWWVGVLNPILLAILASVALKLTGAWPHVPDWAVRTIDLLGGCAIPLSLLLTGATVSDVWPEAELRRGWRTVSAACVLRLGLLPVLMILTGRLLHVDTPLGRVLAIQAAMPAAMFPVVLSRHYGGDAITAVRVVVGTSLIGLVTMPLWLLFALKF